MAVGVVKTLNSVGGLVTAATKGTVDSADMTATAVTPGTYTSATFTVDAAGRVTAASNGTAGATLPSQTGNSGKYLTTDGTTASWAAVSSTGTVTSADGGTTGLLFTTATTTPTLGGVLAVGHGGTGANLPFSARANLGIGTAATLASDSDAALAANSNANIPTQAAVKAYVDAGDQRGGWKHPVRAATSYIGGDDIATGFAAGDYVDGVYLYTGDRILIKDMGGGGAVHTGIYVVNATGAPTRAADANTTAKIKGCVVYVQEGTVNRYTTWANVNTGTYTLGTNVTLFYRTSLYPGNNLSDIASVTAARTNLGLGSLATQSGTFSGTSSGTNTGDQTSVSGNAGTATALANPRNINGVAFDGTASVTVPAAAGTLTGTALPATVVASSLTSVGTLTGGGTGAGFTVALSASTITGTLPAAQMPALTGHVTTAAGGVATTIAAGVVTNAMLAGSIDLASKVTGALPPANGGVPTGAVLPYGGSTAPAGYVLGNGTPASRSGNAALYALYGTAFGAGDGSTTFGIPDLRGRAVVGVGTGTGLTARALADLFGTETHALTLAQIPGHTHPIDQASYTGAGNVTAVGAGAPPGAYPGNANTASAGGGGAHPNVQPSLALNYVIKT